MSWVPINQFVKAFFWSPHRGLLVERAEPTGLNTILQLDLRDLYQFLYQRSLNLRLRFFIRKEFSVVIQNIEDFQIKGDYMFATRKNSKVGVMDM